MLNSSSATANCIKYRKGITKMKNEKGFGIIFLIFLAAAVQVVALQVVNWANKPGCASGFRLESGHCVSEIKVMEASKR